MQNRLCPQVPIGCRRSFYHETLFSRLLSVRKMLVLCFSFFCSCSTLLPGAGASCAHRQQTKTGTGLPSWDSHPSEDLSEPPSLRVPAFCEAVTGRKYHYRLPASWQAIRHGSPWDGHFPLCTFDAIFLTGIPCRWSWRVLRSAKTGS